MELPHICILRSKASKAQHPCPGGTLCPGNPGTFDVLETRFSDTRSLFFLNHYYYNDCYCYPAQPLLLHVTLAVNDYGW